MLIDCPPSLGILAINGLCAADEVVIPLQCETLCNRGVGQLLEMIDDVRMFANAELTVRGIINTLYDERTSHGRFVLADVKERYGLEVLDPPVRKSVRFAEAPEFGRCILQHAPLVGRRRGLPRPRPRARGRPMPGRLIDARPPEREERRA